MVSKPQDFHDQLDRNDARGAVGGPAVTVTTTSAQVLRTNPKRKGAWFINDSDTVMYLALGTLAALNSGIRLNANGGSFHITPDQLGYFWRGPVCAICTPTTKTLLVSEE